MIARLAADAAAPASTILPASLAAVTGLALVHLFSGRLGFREIGPRSGWLSFAGGVSVAYVFVHLLPELEEHQRVIAEALGHGLDFLHHHVYLLALLGLALFYGLQRVTVASRRHERVAGREDATSTGVFWLSMALFGLYNVAIGYLLLHRVGGIGLRTLALFWLAMALHFWINRVSLRERHKDDFPRIGRWVLAGAVVVGWALGAMVGLSEAVISMLMAFLAGALVLNVLTEELPEARHSRFSAFALGLAVYTALLLAV